MADRSGQITLKERKELLKRKRRKSSTVNQAAEIGRSLNRTQQLLQQELHRVSDVTTAITEDGRMLQDSKDQQQSLEVNKAAQALTSLQRAKQHEQRVLMASIAFFWAVFAYIMWCRVLLHIPLLDQLAPLLHGVRRSITEAIF